MALQRIRAVCLSTCVTLSLLAFLAPNCQAWSLPALGLNDKIWLFNILSRKQEDPAWKQCGDLFYQAENALTRKEYEKALQFLQDYETVPCTRASVDIKVWRYIGVLHMLGYGTELNIDKAIKYLLKAAEAKDSEAQYGLGLLLIAEQGDLLTGLFWLDQAAEQGNVKAHYDLGNIYANENSPCPDMEKAAKYYAMGVEKKDVECTYELGLLYYDGLGVDQNLDKARELLTFAAENGKADAAYTLAWMLMHDVESSIKNREEAYLWFNTAKYFKSKLYDKGKLENCFTKELSPESRAKVDKELERFASLIILRTQK